MFGSGKLQFWNNEESSKTGRKGKHVMLRQIHQKWGAVKTDGYQGISYVKRKNIGTEALKFDLWVRYFKFLLQALSAGKKIRKTEKGNIQKDFNETRATLDGYAKN